MKKKLAYLAAGSLLLGMSSAAFAWGSVVQFCKENPDQCWCNATYSYCMIK